MEDVPAFYACVNGKEVFEGLKDHSLRTASVGLTLFERELERLGLLEPFVLAAVLHDVGKANKMVLEKFKKIKLEECKDQKLSFACHELLSAQAAWELRKELGSHYWVVLYSVLRHHHAMRGIKDCFKKGDLVLDRVGKLSELIPRLEELKGLKPSKTLIEHEVENAMAHSMKELKEAYVVTGFLSLADSVAAYLGRVILTNSNLEQGFDSSNKPSRFVRLSLEERGWNLEKDIEKLMEEIRSRENEVIKIVKKYF